MSRVLLLAVLCAGLGLTGCAERKPIPRPELPPLPRSSIAAILQHRAELGLTDEQAQKLQARDDQLDTQNAGLHEPGTQRKRPDGEAGGGMRHGGMGGMGGMGGGGMRGGRHSGGSSAQRESHIESVQEQRDANDTAAFTEIESVLTEVQRPKAEAIASEYREQLFHQREVLKQWRESQGGS
jgi:hypothetical protein